MIFTSTIGWIADKPWEFAYDPTRQAFLCTGDANFVRNVFTAVPADAIQVPLRKLRILIAAAQPVGAMALSVDDERRVIERGFNRLLDHQLVDIDFIRATTPSMLHRKLDQSWYEREPFDVLHFIGHGVYEPAKQMGYLLFEDNEGRSQRVPADVLQQIVCRRGIRLVFLNACETGVGYGGYSVAHSEQAPAHKRSTTRNDGRVPNRRVGETRDLPRFDFNAGVAPALVAGGVPAVVANQFKVLDTSATAFAQHFYWALAAGRSLGDAAREARISVNYLIAGETIDWAIPVLYARNPNDRLVSESEVNSGIAFESATESPSRGRRGGARRERRVGIWDVNTLVPQLEQIVFRLNDIQPYVQFESVDISAPVGTWRLERLDPRTSKGFLRAQRVADRLASVPISRGLHRLFCITSFWLEGNHTLNRYAWRDKTDTISIFSTAGLFDDEHPEFTLERAIACRLVADLSSLDSHKNGSKRCLKYFNAERSLVPVAGSVGFCRMCLHKLDQRLKRRMITPALCEALQAILEGFKEPRSAYAEAQRFVLSDIEPDVKIGFAGKGDMGFVVSDLETDLKAGLREKWDLRSVGPIKSRELKPVIKSRVRGSESKRRRSRRR